MATWHVLSQSRVRVEFKIGLFPEQHERKSHQDTTISDLDSFWSAQ